MTKKEICLYNIRISAQAEYMVRGRFDWSVENKAKKSVDSAIKKWVKSIEKPSVIIDMNLRNHIILLHFKYQAAQKGREGILDYAKQFKKLVREAIKEVGYKPKLI